MKVMAAALLAPASSPNRHIKTDSTVRGAIVIKANEELGALTDIPSGW